MLDRITPVLITYNEEPNISRTLAGLSWATEIIVVDSGSQDGTVPILKSHPRVRLFTRPFDGFASQWEYALRETGVRTEWVLALDADFVVTEEFAQELRNLNPESADGFRAGFDFCIFGRPLRGSLYPRLVVLFRKERGRFIQDGHAGVLRVDGRVAALKRRIRLDDRKPFNRWLSSQSSYVIQEAQKLNSLPWSRLGWADRLRKYTPFAAPAALFYCLFFKGLILEGSAGAHYSLQRTLAELLLTVHLLDTRLRGRAGS